MNGLTVWLVFGGIHFAVRCFESREHSFKDKKRSPKGSLSLEMMGNRKISNIDEAVRER
jgi:hypothetical protein